MIYFNLYVINMYFILVVLVYCLKDNGVVFFFVNSFLESFALLGVFELVGFVVLVLI